MAFSSLPGCDRSPADDSLKRYEQNVKLSGMCFIPQECSSEDARSAGESALSNSLKTRWKEKLPSN